MMDTARATTMGCSSLLSGVLPCDQKGALHATINRRYRRRTAMHELGDLSPPRRRAATTFDTAGASRHAFSGAEYLGPTARQGGGGDQELGRPPQRLHAKVGRGQT